MRTPGRVVLPLDAAARPGWTRMAALRVLEVSATAALVGDVAALSGLYLAAGRWTNSATALFAVALLCLGGMLAALFNTQRRQDRRNSWGAPRDQPG